jgi:hypothetical protein
MVETKRPSAAATWLATPAACGYRKRALEPRHPDEPHRPPGYYRKRATYDAKLIRANRLLLCVLVVGGSLAGVAAPALASWHLAGGRTTSIAYNQGIAFDGARREFFFDGVSSSTSSGVYRTDAQLRQQAANTAVIPRTREGYNHAGDLTFDPVRRRILLPLECYYPSGGGNTCGLGALAVVDPVTLRFRYYVNLARRQIKKAMWDEIEPDGRWIWTSSGTHLLIYPAADITVAAARRQRAGRRGGIVGIDLGSVLPSSGVTGATFYQSRHARTAELLLSLNRGDDFEVVALRISTNYKKHPMLLSHAKPIITLPRSSLNLEPEGLATTMPARGHYPLGGLLHWQMLPAITAFSAFSRILTYQREAPPTAAGLTATAPVAPR